MFARMGEGGVGVKFKPEANTHYKMNTFPYTKSDQWEGCTIDKNAKVQVENSAHTPYPDERLNTSINIQIT